MGMQREINQDLGINIHTTIYKIGNNKDLPHSTNNSTQHLIITYNEKESEKEYIYIYISTLLYT